MEDHNSLMILWMALAGILVQGVTATAPTVHCSNDGMTPEGSLLNCTCGAEGSTTSQFFWPGHSSWPTLLVPNVTRDQNGTIFTCLKQTPGMNNETTIYTLQVAYGPSENDTVIEGPSSFSTDGTKDLTLTCTAKNVNPSPVYAWLNINMCANAKNTCTFKPKLTDNGKEVFCLATNTVLVKTGTAKYKINITTTSAASDHNPSGGHFVGYYLLPLLLFVVNCVKLS